MNKSLAIVKERRLDEKRVVLTPDAVKLFVENGYQVFVEKSAAIGIGIEDRSYIDAGARILPRDEIWNSSSIIVKLLCPTLEETGSIPYDSSVSAFFYAGENMEIMRELMRKAVNAFSYEYFEDSHGNFPLMCPDGNMSGHLAVMLGAGFLFDQNQGRGVLLSAIPGVRETEVVVIGYGNVGGAAARIAYLLGAKVTVFGTKQSKLEKFKSLYPQILCHDIRNQEIFAEKIRSADLVIGTILVSSYDTPPLIDDSLVKTMKKGSVLIDVTCGYGKGYLPTADKVTLPGSPPYIRHGVLHYKNPRLPSMVPVTGAAAVSRTFAPYILAMTESIYFPEKTDICSSNGKILTAGNISNAHVRQDFESVTSGQHEPYDIFEHLSEPLRSG